MKNLLTAVLPALALFALGGCAGTSALTSTEDDGVYYSSKDRTTAVVSAVAPASPGSAASTSEEANPDYNGNASGAARSASSSRNGTSSDEYYDNSYSYMRGVPGYRSSVYYGPGLATYSPYSPYTSIATICTGYGPYGYGCGGVSPYGYGFADPFYSPFGDPFFSPYGYGSAVSISFGFGRPYYGGFYGYGRPYAYGGFYDPYFYGSPYYGGYYSRRGYYGSNYYGGRNGYNNGGNGGYYPDNNPQRARTAGHRSDRASDGRYSSNAAGPITTSGNSTSTGSGRGRERDFRGTATSEQPAEGLVKGGRARDEARTATPADGGYNKPRDINYGRRQYDQDAVLNEDTRRADRLVRDRDDSRRGREVQPVLDNNQPDAVAQPRRRRDGFFQAPVSQPSDNPGQPTEQPIRQRSYERPQPVQRTYEQPQRSYEQPQRSYSQPSNSAPSNSSGDGGRRGRD